MVEKAHADVEPALHSSRVALRPIAGAIGQPDELQDLRDALVEQLPRQALEPAEEAQVLASRQVRVDRQVLGHVADGGLGIGGVDVDRPAVDDDLAAVAPEKPADHRDSGGLAGAVRTQQAVGLAGRDREADAGDSGSVAEALPQVAALEKGRGPGHRTVLSMRVTTTGAATGGLPNALPDARSPDEHRSSCNHRATAKRPQVPPELGASSLPLPDEAAAAEQGHQQQGQKALTEQALRPTVCSSHGTIARRGLCADQPAATPGATTCLSGSAGSRLPPQRRFS